MRTKLIVTIGPASFNPRIIRDLAENGARIFRINLSHATAKDFAPAVKWVRRAERELGVALTVAADLPGPKLRIGPVENGPLEIPRNGKLILSLPGFEPKGENLADIPRITLDNLDVLAKLAKGMTVFLSDGMLEFEISKVLSQGEAYLITACNSGLLTSRKGVIFPQLAKSGPSLTRSDRVNVREVLEIGVDVFMFSAQSARDVMDLKAEIAAQGHWVPIMAKLETLDAVKRVNEIAKASDAVMISRGDMSLVCPMEDLPIIQKKIIRTCRGLCKPVAVATQMLPTMVKNPRPARPEVTDVANAILDGADGITLSDETAIGDNPLESVQAMRDIARRAEAYYFESLETPLPPSANGTPETYLAYSACTLAAKANSAALVSHTRTGITARQVSACRPPQSIYALTPSDQVRHLLNLSWGVIPVKIPRQPQNHLSRCERFVQKTKRLKAGQNVVITAGQKSPGCADQHTNEMKVYYK